MMFTFDKNPHQTDFGGHQVAEPVKPLDIGFQITDSPFAEITLIGKNNILFILFIYYKKDMKLHKTTDSYPYPLKK